MEQKRVLSWIAGNLYLFSYWFAHNLPCQEQRCTDTSPLPCGRVRLKGPGTAACVLGQFLYLLLAVVAKDAEQVLEAQQICSLVDISVSLLAGGGLFTEPGGRGSAKQLEHVFWDAFGL